MKLTQEQINRLYQFTTQHYVWHYDLQLELVDHLANAIEQQWQENPNVAFEDALQTVFKKFGDSGFMKLVNQRKKALTIKCLKLIWFHFKTFFKIPRIILTFLAVFFVFYILKNNDFKQTYFTVLHLVVAGLTIIFCGLVMLKKIKRHKNKQKRWLFEDIIWDLRIVSILLSSQILIWIPVINSVTTFFTSDIGLSIASFLLVSYILLSYIMMVAIPSKTEQYLKETYPEYELSN